MSEPVMHDSQEDRKKVLAAIGGTRGLIDSGLPSLLFLIVLNLTDKNVQQAGMSAMVFAALLALIRIFKRETLQHVLSGFFGVLICYFFARHSGKASDFYLPGLITNLVYGIGYAFANLIGWPVLGLMLGPILGENLLWRHHPERKRAYIRAGWLWVALFLGRLTVQYPLYRANQVNLLGTARLVMGYPLFIATAWGSWLIIRKVPTVKAQPIEDEESGSK